MVMAFQADAEKPARPEARGNRGTGAPPGAIARERGEAGKATGDAGRQRFRIGVLAVQGDFEAHGRALAGLGAAPVYVRTPQELEGLDGLILPGGESTTMLRFLETEGLFEAIQGFAGRHPLMGTCAGAILMATEVTRPAQRSLGLIDMTVERNAYGRQVDSRIASLSPPAEFAERAGPGPLETVFIRAPIIRRVGPQAAVLLRFQNDPILVEQGRHMAATFHPELTADPRVHRLFLNKVAGLVTREP
jgi:5'-phosphate synthase pdxT subunit